MSDNASTIHTNASSFSAGGPGKIRIKVLGNSLGSFTAITFVLCVIFDLVFPAYAMNRVWAPLFPGFSWLSWGSFLIGIVESFAYGWYVAIFFAPIYNFFQARSNQVV